MLIETAKLSSSSPKRRGKGAIMAVRSKNDGKAYAEQNNRDTAAVSFSMPVETPIIDGLVAFDDDVGIRALCRDMYYHDPICGGAVDIYSKLPFGDFSLSGLPEKEMLYKFYESLSSMRVKTLMPSMAVDYFVDGAATGAMNFDKERKIFDTYIPLNLDDVTLHHIPLYGITPLMDVKFPDDYRRVFGKKGDPRITKIIEELPEMLRKPFTQGGMLELLPDNSIYIPRTSRSYHRRGVSIFHRLIPYWILEKALLRGTIAMAYRRQRGILVIQMGSDLWQPTVEDMQAHINEVILADRDPHGAVIAMRPDIAFQEIRDGNAFWKHSDTVDQYNQLKMKALGISDAAFSGESSVGDAQSIMSIFNQQLRTTREELVRSFLYERAFPIISRENDYRKEDKFIETSSFRDDDESFMRREAVQMRKNKDGMYSITAADESDAQYHIPSLNFHNSLRPEASAEYMQNLQTLTALGVPIPLRTIVASAGLSVGDILAGEDEDVDLRKAFDSYNKRIKKFLPQPEEMGGGGGDFASHTLSPPGTQRPGIKGRADQFGEFNDAAAFKRNGNRLVSARGRKLMDEQHNRVIAEAAANIAREQNANARK